MFKLFKKNKKDTWFPRTSGLPKNNNEVTQVTFDKPISAYMKDMLAKSGYSQKEVADIMCVTKTSVSKWLSGDRIPKVSDFLKFCNVCGYDLVIIDRLL